ncbi:MAG: EAL domain-containing protein [Solirubrobacterales bacterium]
MSTPHALNASTTADAEELDRILRDRLITSLYQPIIDLASRDTVGYEALARGPKGSPLEFPDRLFATARETGRIIELDWECRGAAARGALEFGLLPPLQLFVNIEPEAAFVPPPEHLRPLMREVADKLRVVCEFTERRLIDRPADLLAAARLSRKSGMSVALDDVGVDTNALALLAYLRPEIIKLDLTMMQSELTPEIATTLHAVSGWTEKTETVVVAEGIETDEHLFRARAMGAHMAQGWKYGKPAPPTDFVPSDTARPTTMAMPSEFDAETELSPFELISQRREVCVASRRMLVSLMRRIEQVADVAGPTGILIGSCQNFDRIDDATRQHYRALARSMAMVGVIGAGAPDESFSGIRTSVLDADDRLTNEWIVCVVSASHGAAVIARDLGDDGPELDRRYSFCMTHNQELATAATRQLIERMMPISDHPPAAAPLRLAT